MSRPFHPLAVLVLLAVAAALSACDSTAEPPLAEVTAGATYDASVFALRDAETGALVYDYLPDGAVLSIKFVDDERFEFRLLLSEESLRASGEVDDVEGGIDVTLAGTYAQRGGVLTFALDESGESFLLDTGWTVVAGGSAIRYEGTGEDVIAVIVLTRR